MLLQMAIFHSFFMANLEDIKLSKVRQKEKDKYDVTYMWNLKIIQINLYTKHKQIHRHRKQTYGYQRGEWGKEEEEIN